MEEENQVKKYSIHIGLFLITLFTTTAAGQEWMGLAGLSWWDGFLHGFEYSLPFLGILTVHEFGHFITARKYGAKVSLPYFIPFYIPGLGTIGTFGAFIRILSAHKSRKEVFDIGIAGPLAGFVAAMILLFYGFTHLPQPGYIYKVHESYQQYGPDYAKKVYTYQFARDQDSIVFYNAKKQFEDQQDADSLAFLAQQKSQGNNKPVVFNKKKFKDGESFKASPLYTEVMVGNNLLFMFFEKYVVDDPKLVPNKYELFHYPLIFAGFLVLFFTALNLLPIGQLDGGHIAYGLFGARNHKLISMSVFVAMVYLGGLGLLRNNMFANVFNSVMDLLLFAPMYVYLLFMIFSRFTGDQLTNLMVAVCVFAAQYFTEFLFPDFHGISLIYVVFSLLIGRMTGLDHPEAFDDRPLSLARKILGWVSLLVFILCFTPFLLDTVFWIKK
ncbi:MAG: site-2 protease family protein [Cytophagaceae bacterium]